MTKQKRQFIWILLAGVVFFFIAGIIIIIGNVDSSGTAANLVLCLDDSGSMHSKQEQRNEAATEFVENLGNNVNLGVLYFQYKVTTVSEMKNLGKMSHRKHILDTISMEEHEEDHGNTNAGEALSYALSMLETIRQEEDKKDLPSSILLFTDGKNDFLDEDGERRYSYVQEADELTKDAAKEAAEDGIAIHAICLNEKDNELLMEVTEETGGTYWRIDSMDELSGVMLEIGAPYLKPKLQGGKIGMEILILLVVVAVGGVGAYSLYRFKTKEYLLDYQVDRMKEDMDERNKKEELDAHIREEQKNKMFYLDVVLTHENAIGAWSCFDFDGRRRKGILPIGDIVMIGRNQRGEDYKYRIDEAGMELWATFDEDELILRSKKTPFEIRKEGMAKDQGTSTQKANIKAGQQYYIVLGSRHEIGLLATRGI